MLLATSILHHVEESRRQVHQVASCSIILTDDPPLVALGESDYRLYLALGRVCFIKYPVLVVIRSRYNSKSSCYRRSQLFE